MTETRPAAPPNWYEHAFGELYPVLYAHRTVEAARKEAQTAAERVHLNDTDHVLDLACGGGRHMVHLIGQAATVTGLDYSTQLLDIASQTLGEHGRLVRADMRAIPFIQAFDVVVNFFTSLGYFLSAEENRSTIREIGKALKPGGRFFIDYVNRAHVERTLTPDSVRHESGYDIVETRWIAEPGPRVNKTTVVSEKGREIRRIQESVRLYAPDEFRELLAAGGMAVDEMLGDYAGGPLEETRPRMIVIGHKT